MSAFIVCKKHIDALLTAGLNAGRGMGLLRWLTPAETYADTEGTTERGEPWGPNYIEVLNRRRRELTDETAGRVGAMLWAENQRSVDHRYDDNDTEEPYVYEHYPRHLKPVEVLKAIGCYEYQSCEHPEWEQSEAHEFCQALKQRMIHQLPGYDAAEWEIR